VYFKILYPLAIYLNCNSDDNLITNTIIQIFAHSKNNLYPRFTKFAIVAH